MNINIAVECDTVWSSTSVPTISEKLAAFVISVGEYVVMELESSCGAGTRSPD
jgi:hypothetical protein